MFGVSKTSSDLSLNHGLANFWRMADHLQKCDIVMIHSTTHNFHYCRGININWAHSI